MAEKAKAWNMRRAMHCWLEYNNYLDVCYLDGTWPMNYSEFVAEYGRKHGLQSHTLPADSPLAVKGGGPL